MHLRLLAAAPFLLPSTPFAPTFFFTLFASSSISFSSPLLPPCVFPSLSVYMCMCVTQIAVDGFNQMAAPFCCFSVVFPFLYGSLPYGVFRHAQLRKKQRCASTLSVRSVTTKKKTKKKNVGGPPATQRRILTELVSGQMQCFGSHTSLSVVSSAIFLCTVFKEKKMCTQNKQEKKVYKCKTTKKSFFFFLREGFELHPVSLFAVHCSFVYS